MPELHDVLHTDHCVHSVQPPSTTIQHNRASYHLVIFIDVLNVQIIIIDV